MLQELPRPSLGVPGGHAEVATVVDEQFARGQETIEVHLLRRETEEQPDRPGVGDGVVTEYEQLAGIDAYQPGSGPDERRLAGAVGTEQPEERPLGNGQPQTGESDGPPGVDLDQVLGDQCRDGGVVRTQHGRRVAPPPLGEGSAARAASRTSPTGTIRAGRSDVALLLGEPRHILYRTKNSLQNHAGLRCETSSPNAEGRSHMGTAFRLW